MKVKIPTWKTVEIPKICQITLLDDVVTIFKYSYYTEHEDIVFYVTEFGWGVYVDVNTLEVISPTHKENLFLGKKMVDIDNLNL